MDGYIYFLRHSGSGMIKIGFSQNPDNRLSQIRSYLKKLGKWNDGDNLNIIDMILLSDIEFGNGLDIEFGFHAALSERREYGEWFRISDKEIVPIIKSCRKIVELVVPGFKGVSWGDWDRKWQAQFMVNRKVTHLGYFNNTLDAAWACGKAKIRNAQKQDD